MTFLLEPLGLGEVDSRAFLALLATPRATAAELSDGLRVPVDAVRRTLARLVDAGLVTRLVSRPARFVLAEPGPAVDALVTRRKGDLERLRGDARELAARFTTGAPGVGTDLVELVEGADAVHQQAARLQSTAKDEVLLVDAPPYPAGRAAVNEPELVALGRSVRYRTIYHAPSLHEPDHFEQMREAVAAGEQARSLAAAQTKMLVVDGLTAMVPMGFEATERAAHLLVRSSPLLDALVGWFESLWARAAPIVVSETALLPTERDRRLLALLASGAQDRAIAHTLGVTERTVSRRVAELMTHLSTETRFQAGLRAVRLGWL